MAITRAMNNSIAADGEEWADIVDETVNQIYGQILGRLTAIAGTANVITANVAISTGFTSLTDGAQCELIPETTTTGTVTLAIQSGSAIAIRDETGAALSATRVMTAGTIYFLKYDSTEGFWRITNYLAPDTAGDIEPSNYSFLQRVTASGVNWTAPWKCNVRFWVIGGGGSGGHQASTNARSSGGGAGGVGMVEIQSAASVLYTITIPTQAAGVAKGNDGNAGGSTVVSGSGMTTITATGGGPGVYETTGTATGGTGGTSTGGDKNWAGGDGGDASAVRCAGGGGACGIIADGYAGESISTNYLGGDGGSLGSSTALAHYNDITMAPFALNGIRGGAGGDAAQGEDATGIFCGGGGAGNAAADGGGAIYGGGGGGAAYSSGSGIFSGAGGEGLVIIEYTGPIS